MAANETIFDLNALNSTPPTTTPAAYALVADASTPPAQSPVIAFDGSSDEFMDWHVTLPSNYAGGTGLTFEYDYAMDGVDGDNVQMQFSVVKLNAGVVLTADQGLDTATSVDITDTPSGTADAVDVSPTGALAKASMGTPVAGDRIIIRAQRNVAIAVNGDDLQLMSIKVTETA